LICYRTHLSGPRTGDEDVHQSPGALLPVRGGRNIGDADKCSKQVEWVEIFTYVAALDCALHQRINCSLDLSARTFIQFRVTSNERIQGRGDNLLGRDVVDEQQHPGSQCFNRRHGLGELLLGCGELFHLSSIDRLEQCIARRKVAVQSSRSNARLFGDVIEAGICA